MKRQLSLVLALVMILGSFSSVFAANPVETVVDAGAFLKNAGVLVGDENGDLNLGENLSRQDAVILVAQLRGAIDEAKAFPTLPTYGDVRIKFYNAPLAWAQAENLFVGHSDVKFGFDENLTAQEYSKVLLTALGYSVAPNGDSDIKWAEALDKAEEFGVLANVEVVNSTTITRGEMALMTFNALGVNMKGSKETLADTLGIEMPEGPEAKELTAEVNDTVNLKEVVLELSNAKLADEDKLKDKNNYRVEKFKVEKVTVDGDDVILLLEEALVKNRTYDLTVRGLDKAIDKTYTFKAYDNESPEVVAVEVLGEYGIKVTTSEPVRDPQERDFLVDGKNVAMVREVYGRDIILTPYHNSSFPANAETLTIKGLEDFEGYKSALVDFDIEIVKDDAAPEVTDVTVDGKVVTVTFDKDIYKKSVSGYINGREEGNISYRSGRYDMFTQQHKDGDYGKKIDTNKVRYTFDENLPKGTEVTIVGVQNHSKVTMERTKIVVRELKNNLEPIIADYSVSTKVTTPGSIALGEATVTLEFDKALELNVIKSLNSDGEVTDTIVSNADLNQFKLGKGYFNLYTEKVLSRYEANNGEEITKVVLKDYDKADRGYKTMVLTIDGVVENDTDRRYDYILEVKNFEDTSGNKMYTDYVEFEFKISTDFEVDGNVDVNYDSRRKELKVDIYFNKSVDRNRAEDLTNYLFRKQLNTTGAKVFDLDDLDGEVIVDRNGKRVTLILKDVNETEFKSLEILPALRDVNNNRLSGNRFVQLVDAAGELVNHTTTTGSGITLD